MRNLALATSAHAGAPRYLIIAAWRMAARENLMAEIVAATVFAAVSPFILA